MSIDKGQSNFSVAKSAGLIGSATFISRVLGFVRDVVIARLFGVYTYAQAFVIAFKIPNLFRDFVGEGAANAAFVPVFSEYALKGSKEEFWELANVMLNILLVVLTAITLLGIIFSPFLIRLVAPGFVVFIEKFSLTVKLNRIIFPYILLIALAAYSTALLNSLKHFAIPAFAPALLNISIIIFALLYGEGIRGLSLGVLIGGVLQLAVQIPVLYRKGFRLKRPLTLKHPGARQIRKLMLPRLLNSCIYQLNNFVDSAFGSLSWIVGEGGVAVLYFSYRLIQFPLGIFSNAISQAILPTLSRQAISEEKNELKDTLSFGLRAVFLVMLPASVFFIVVPAPLVKAIFSGGKFDSYSVGLTSQALLFYSIGLTAYGASKVLQASFFSLKDTATPTKVSALNLILNIILNSILMFPFKIAGIALASSISGIAAFLVLFALLKSKIGDFGISGIISSFLRILASSICMGVICYFSMQLTSNRFISVATVLVVGFISYIIFCFIFKVEEIRQIFSWITKRE
ncbi:MAG: murein biosynthesis integral membrane protein MurJ [Candidatus Omnitrophica bacterium]|nr:murein biosynthesis integral membrane protein MurJ [Candidatus Omnitrophota bacterium]